MAARVVSLVTHRARCAGCGGSGRTGHRASCPRAKAEKARSVGAAGFVLSIPANKMMNGTKPPAPRPTPKLDLRIEEEARIARRLRAVPPAAVEVARPDGCTCGGGRGRQDGVRAHRFACPLSHYRRKLTAKQAKVAATEEAEVLEEAGPQRHEPEQSRDASFLDGDAEAVNRRVNRLYKRGLREHFEGRLVVTMPSGNIYLSGTTLRLARAVVDVRAALGRAPSLLELADAVGIEGSTEMSRRSAVNVRLAALRELGVVAGGRGDPVLGPGVVLPAASSSRASLEDEDLEGSERESGTRQWTKDDQAEVSAWVDAVWARLQAGERLRAILGLREGEVLGEAELAAIEARHAAGAVEEAPIVHRDVKPANVVLRDRKPSNAAPVDHLAKRASLDVQAIPPLDRIVRDLRSGRRPTNAIPPEVPLNPIFKIDMDETKKEHVMAKKERGGLGATIWEALRKHGPSTPKAIHDAALTHVCSRPSANGTMIKLVERGFLAQNAGVYSAIGDVAPVALVGGRRKGGAAPAQRTNGTASKAPPPRPLRAPRAAAPAPRASLTDEVSDPVLAALLAQRAEAAARITRIDSAIAAYRG